MSKQKSFAKAFNTFFDAALQIRVAENDGKIVVVGGNISVIWVVYEDFDTSEYEEVTVGDVYLLNKQLPEFAKNPYKYAPKDSLLNDVFVFGINDDFLKDIAPSILKLVDAGAPRISYYSWNDKTYKRTDAVEAAINLLGVASEPSTYRTLKESMRKNNNGVYNIEDLAYIKNLRKLVRAV